LDDLISKPFGRNINECIKLAGYTVKNDKAPQDLCKEICSILKKFEKNIMI
jgi:hypothetical protein